MYIVLNPQGLTFGLWPLIAFCWGSVTPSVLLKHPSNSLHFKRDKSTNTLKSWGVGFWFVVFVCLIGCFFGWFLSPPGFNPRALSPWTSLNFSQLENLALEEKGTNSKIWICFFLESGRWILFTLISSVKPLYL